MPKDKLVAIKDAAQAAGVDEETLRRELEQGLLKGEKKSNWFWDDWYVSGSEMERLKERRKNRFRRGLRAQQTADQQVEGDGKRSPEPLPTPGTILSTLLGPELPASEAETEKDQPGWRVEYREVIKRVAEEIMRPLLERLEMQSAALREKDVLIAQQAQQLRLLPDFEKRELEHLAALAVREKEAEELAERMIVQQNEAMREREQLETTLQKQLAELQSEIAELRKPWWKKVFKSD